MKKLTLISKEINKLLDGHSIAYVSNYADEIKSDKNYRKFSPWHYVNFPFGSSYEVHPKNDKGDLIDTKGYHKAIYAAENVDTIAKHFYEQGKADAIKDVAANRTKCMLLSIVAAQRKEDEYVWQRFE